MKKRLFVILSIFTLLFLFSCGSKPEEEAAAPEAPVEEVQEEVVEEISQEEADAFIAEIEAARSSVIEAGAETKAPEELKKIDDYFASIKDDKTALKNEYTKVVDMYNALLNNIKAKDAEEKLLADLLADIDAARTATVNAGAEEFAPEELKKLDDYVASLKSDNTKLKAEGSKVSGYYEEVSKLVADRKAEALKEAEEAKKASDILTSIEDARKKAIAAGAETFAAEELKKLDDYMETLKADRAVLIAEGLNVTESYNQLIEVAKNAERKANIDKILVDIADARSRAVAAGVNKVIPEELKKLDDYVETLKADEDELEKSGPAVQASYDSLIVTMNEVKAENKLLSTIDIARNKALKAGAEEVAADELKKLDDYLESLRNDKESWKAEGSKVPEYYNSLAVFAKDRKIANNLLLNIDSSRKMAVDAGAETKAPDKLQKIDDYVEAIKQDSNNVKSTGHKASNAYKSLVPYIGAMDAKKIVDEENLASYAQTSYDRASENIAQIEKYYDDIDTVPQTIINDATNARRDYRNVITTAYKKMAKTERELAYEAKKNADKVRAGVTQKERYKDAVDNFKKGDSLYSMQDAKNAIKYYEAAKKGFDDLHSEVSEEMLAALAAIEAAKRNVAESSQYAEEADEVAPITRDSLEGIEEEDTVLLEADDYEDPNASVITVEDTVEVKEDAVTEEEPEVIEADEQYVEVEEPEVEEDDAEGDSEAETDEAETETEAETEDAAPEAEVTETETAPAPETESEATEPEVETEAETETVAPAPEAETTETETAPAPETEPEATEPAPETETAPETVPEAAETPVATDEVVTDSTAATEENSEVTEEVTYDVEVSEK